MNFVMCIAAATAWFAGCSENGEGGERGAERCQRVCGFVGSCWRVQQVGIG